MICARVYLLAVARQDNIATAMSKCAYPIVLPKSVMPASIGILYFVVANQIVAHNRVTMACTGIMKYASAYISVQIHAPVKRHLYGASWHVNANALII